MAWKVGDEADNAAIGLYYQRFGQAGGIEGFALRSGIVAALDVDGRAQEVDNVVGCVFRKDGDVIDAGQGGQNFGTLTFWYGKAVSRAIQGESTCIFCQVLARSTRCSSLVPP